MTTKAGVPTGAVFGFTNMLLRLAADHHPTHLAVVFDAGAPVVRAASSTPPTRPTAPSRPTDLLPQFDIEPAGGRRDRRRVLDAADVEADDLIATLVAAGPGARPAGGHRLVGQGPHAARRTTSAPRHDEEGGRKIYDPAEVEEKFGVPPAQLGDVLALMGDSVDNVPGVPGVGPKTAAQLIRQFGSLEALLARIDEVAALKGARRRVGGGQAHEPPRAGCACRGAWWRSTTRVPVPMPLDALRRHRPACRGSSAMLRELEFTRS